MGETQKKIKRGLSHFMLKKTKAQIAYEYLSKMNLTRDSNDPKKEPYLNDRELADRLGMSRGVVSNAKKALQKYRKVRCFYLVYVWRWSGDDSCAKIGESTIVDLDSRMAATYHPKDDPILLGVMECRNREEAKYIEKSLLDRLQRTRPDREWVIIDERFNETIDKAFFMP